MHCERLALVEMFRDLEFLPAGSDNRDESVKMIARRPQVMTLTDACTSPI